MSRARIAVAASLAISVAAVSILAGASAGAGASFGDTGGFRYTHRFTVTARLVDRWTVNDTSNCGRTGGGTFTVTFRTAKAAKAEPFIDPSQNSEPNNALGSWILAIGVEGQRGIQGINPRPGSASVTSIDKTTPGPNQVDGGPCPALDKADCGTSQDKGAKVRIHGYDRRRLVVDLAYRVPNTGSHGVRCYLGSIDGPFSDRRLGGSRYGEFLLTMPSPQTLAQRSVVRVTGTSHKRISTADVGLSSTDDVTRTVTVTFTRL